MLYRHSNATLLAYIRLAYQSHAEIDRIIIDPYDYQYHIYDHMNLSSAWMVTRQDTDRCSIIAHSSGPDYKSPPELLMTPTSNPFVMTGQSSQGCKLKYKSDWVLRQRDTSQSQRHRATQQSAICYIDKPQWPILVAKLVSIDHARLFARAMEKMIPRYNDVSATRNFQAPTPALLSYSLRSVYRSRVDYADTHWIHKKSHTLYISMLLRAGVRWHPSIDRELNNFKSTGHQLYTHDKDMPTRQQIIDIMYEALPKLQQLTIQINTKHLEDRTEQIPCDWIVRTYITMRIIKIPGELISHIMSFIPLLEIPLSSNSFHRYICGLYF